MKKLLFLLLPAMFLFACNSVETKTEKEECCGEEECCEKDESCEQKCKEAIHVDELMANLEEYVDQDVMVCGLCTHICDHSGKNIFVNSFEDEEILIVGKAAEGVEAFDKALEGTKIMVIGKLVAVEVESEEEIEVHNEVELDYYIEVTEVKQCGKGDGHHGCKGEGKEEGCGEHKKEGCDGKKEKKECDGHHDSE